MNFRTLLVCLLLPLSALGQSLPSPAMNGANVQVTATGSTTSRTMAARAADIANVLDFGVGGAAVNTACGADTRAAFVAALATGKEVYAPAGCYLVSAAIPLGPNQRIRGAGQALTTIKLAAGANSDLITTTSAYTWFGTNTASGTNNWSLSDITLDGNKSQQTATGSSIDAVNGIAIYGAAWRLSGVTIKNILGNGIRSEWYQFGEFSMEALLADVTIDTVGRHGWWFKGPHDSNGFRIVVIDASQEADNTYDGIKVEGNGNGRFIDFHGWHRSSATNRVAYQFFSSGGNELANSHFEGGRGQLYHAGTNDSVVNSTIYAPFGSSGAALVVFAGNQNIHVGNKYTGRTGQSYYAIQLGVAGTSVSGVNVIGGQFNFFDSLGPFNFLNDAGLNSIQGAGAAAVGGATAFAGTRSATTAVNYTQTGTQIAAYSFIPVVTPADGSIAGGGTRGSGCVDLQSSRTLATQVCSGFNSGILSGVNNTVGSAASNSVVVGGSTNSVGSAGNAIVAGGQNNFATQTWSATIGGKDNNASASWSITLGGSANTADGQFSLAAGSQASARGQSGVFALGGGKFSAQGDAQTRMHVLRAAITNTSATRLTVDAAAAAAASIIALPNNSAYELTCKLVAHSTTTQDAANWTLDNALITRGASASTTAVVGGAWTAVQASSGATGKLTAAIAADTTLGGVSLTLTATSGTWNAVARCTTTEVQ